VHVQLAPVSDQRVALETVDVNASNRDFGAVDEDFFDDVAAVRKFSLTASSIESATRPAISV